MGKTIVITAYFSALIFLALLVFRFYDQGYFDNRVHGVLYSYPFYIENWIHITLCLLGTIISTTVYAVGNYKTISFSVLFFGSGLITEKFVALIFYQERYWAITSELKLHLPFLLGIVFVVFSVYELKNRFLVSKRIISLSTIVFALLNFTIGHFLWNLDSIKFHFK